MDTVACKRAIKWCEADAQRYLAKCADILIYANYLEATGQLDAAKNRRRKAYNWAREATECHKDAQYYRDCLVTNQP